MMQEKQEYLAAASELIESLNAPPQAHAIWVHTAVDPDTKEFVQTLRGAIHPAWKKKLSLPTQFAGKPVVQVDWETLEPINKG